MTHKGPSVNRRKVLKNSSLVAGAGFAGLTANDNILKSVDREIDIVTLKSNGEPVKYEKVPQDWLDNLRHVKRAADEVAESFMNKSGVTTVGISKSNQNFGGMSGFQISLKLTSEEVSSAVPSAVQGVNVEYDVVDRNDRYSGATTMSSCYNDTDFFSVPGGVVLDNATSCCSVKKAGSGNKRMMAAAHVYRNSCSDNLAGTSTYQNGDYLGDIKDWDHKRDVVFIDDNGSSRTLDETIEDTTLGSNPINGWITENGVASYMSKDTRMHKMGHITGHTTGRISDMYITDQSCNNTGYNGHGVEIKASSWFGDSGAPLFHNDSQGWFMLGILHTGTCEAGTCDGRSGCAKMAANTSEGTAAYELYDQYFLDFGVNT